LSRLRARRLCNEAVQILDRASPSVPVWISTATASPLSPPPAALYFVTVIINTSFR
jgi:hypothetical protein